MRSGLLSSTTVSFAAAPWQFFISSREYAPASTPTSAQPPTPSATPVTWPQSEMKYASSPPLAIFSGCGSMNAPDTSFNLPLPLAGPPPLPPPLALIFSPTAPLGMIWASSVLSGPLMALMRQTDAPLTAAVESAPKLAPTPAAALTSPSDQYCGSERHLAAGAPPPSPPEPPKKPPGGKGGAPPAARGANQPSPSDAAAAIPAAERPGFSAADRLVAATSIAGRCGGGAPVGVPPGRWEPLVAGRLQLPARATQYISVLAALGTRLASGWTGDTSDEVRGAQE
mmetsp:Transcript_47482/g.121197  ORF Transcript_47482/g.121197 Transcript_47482/m.121197 type:complete len:284 (-) Transcript_47482:122-973(-)